MGRVAQVGMVRCSLLVCVMFGEGSVVCGVKGVVCVCIDACVVSGLSVCWWARTGAVIRHMVG
jgi:hypothetical protein